MPHLPSSLARVVSSASCALLLGLAACGESKEHARADSIKAAEAAQQLALATQLAAQKDSLMNVVLDADKFIAQIDSQVSRVKGLPKRQKSKVEAEGVLQEQLEARQDMLFKVDALVKRAQVTARQLAESKRREKGLRDENAALKDSLGKDEQVIADLGRTIQRQSAQIGELQSTVLTLTDSTVKLGEELKVVQASSARVYYVIGRESDLVKKGLVVKEGGMNLLVGRAGKTLQPARRLDASQFKAIDAREVSRIEVPDTTKRYTIVSRQSLDDAEVRERNKSTFKGHLKITDPAHFWAPSRYLIIVQR